MGDDEKSVWLAELGRGDDPERLEAVPDLPSADELLVATFLGRTRFRASTDWVAAYRPWHACGDDGWGVHISEEALIAFANALASLTNSTASRIAPLALRQVLSHEWVHFACEVVATHIEDLLGRGVYLHYRCQRFDSSSRWSAGPLEELVATHAEVRFARGRLPKWLYPKPAGYAAAVAEVARRSPPGYRDFAAMEKPGEASRIVASLASGIAGRPLVTDLWTNLVTDEERSQVPIYWYGDATTLAAFGAAPKQLSVPTIRRFRRWLNAIGAEEVKGGKGSHVKVRLPNGRRTTYTPGGHLLPRDARSFADRLGLDGERELYALVAEMRVPARSPDSAMARV